MFFRNLMVYSLPAEWCAAFNPSDFAEALEKHPLLPVNAASMQSVGWVDTGPAPGLVYESGNHYLISLGIEQRILPASVINQAAKARAEELEKQQGFAPGRKQMRDIKDQIADELRPKAFVKRRTIRGWIDIANRRVIVDTSSPRQAEEFCTVLRADCGELPAVPLDPIREPGCEMTNWLLAAVAPLSFTLQDACEIIADNAAKSSVRVARSDLDDAKIRSMVADGKTVASLALAWRERLSLVLTDKMVVKRVRMLHVTDREGDKRDESDAFAGSVELFCGETAVMLNDLIAAMGGEKGQQAVSDDLSEGKVANAESDISNSELDPLYEKAVALVLASRKVSISWLQRQLTIGYVRSAFLIERMEVEGIVSPSDGSGHREVLKPAPEAAAA